MLVDGSTSDDRLTFYEGLIPEGGPPLHVHDFDEILLVVSGSLLVRLDGENTRLGEGDFAWLAAGHPHTFANPGPEPVRAIGLGLPGGVEHLFAERGEYLASLSEHEAPDPQRMAKIYSAHASRVVGPPIDF
jgi:mannose-6-phosphate isomerase-like protein (cupin superfamily)